MLLTRHDISSRTVLQKQVNEHPFLLIRRSDFAALQARCGISPWSAQCENALHDARSVIYTRTARIDIRSITLARVLSTTALAYIIDPKHRPYYLSRIIEHLQPFDPDEPGSIIAEMRATDDKVPWKYGVPTGNAFFQAVLALDIIHDDLPTRELARIERFMQEGPAQYFYETKLAWRQGSLAAKAIWPIYKRDATTYQPVVDDWQKDVFKSISADGVFGGGTGYADARWTFADREYKAQFGDVLAHVGILPGWYEQPQLRSFQEWLSGYAYTPFRVLWTFGDGAPGMFFGEYQPGPERAYRYSERAGKYASWLRGNATLPSGLASYVLTAQKPPAGEAAPSRIFPDGGAWLKETKADTLSLAGAMWNLKSLDDAHAHKETNSLCLAAYGELLLRGSGYNGWDTAEKGFSWTYIHDRAISANTVLFDYAIPTTDAEEKDPAAENDHVIKVGAGVTAGLLTGVVDYACGDSGDAIPNGRHVRNFLFVHPSDGVSGYFAVVDELAAHQPGATGHIVWHPSSAAYTETVRNQEYTWTMREFGPSDVSLTIFLGTTPDHSLMRNGVLSNWDKGIVGKYLVGNYSTGESGRKSVVTVLFPHDAAHPKADFARIQGEGFSGAAICQDGIVDRLFEVSGPGVVSIEADVQTDAQAAYTRRSATGELLAAWMKEFSVATFDGIRIESPTPISVLYQNRRLHVASDKDVRVALRFASTACVDVKGGDASNGQLPSKTATLDLPLGTSVVTVTTDLCQ